RSRTVGARPSRPARTSGASARSIPATTAVRSTAASSSHVPSTAAVAAAKARSEAALTAAHRRSRRLRACSERLAGGGAPVAGADGAERAVVAGREGGEHVQRLGPADLADDDPVGPHAERVADEPADRHLAAALEVGWASFQPDDVRLAQPQLGRVLDRHDAL